MKVLGIGGSGHDYSVCVVNNGVIEIAIEEERFSRERYAMGLRSNSFSGLYKLLEETNTNLDDYDLIAANSLMSPKFLKAHLGGRNILLINHHMSHAASTFYTSRFEECAIFVADGCGSDNETISMMYGSPIGIRCLEKYYGYIENDYSMDYIRTHSYGEFYAFFSQICGFNRNHAGKTMGLSPYGNDTYVDLFKKLFYVDDSNTFVTKYDDRQLDKLIQDIYDENDPELRWKMRTDIAYATQTILEECILKQLVYLQSCTKSPNLCFAGGTALNCTLNAKIIKQTPFKAVYVMPAANDTGTAIGAALFAYYESVGQKRERQWLESPLVGLPYDEKEFDSSGNKRNPQWLSSPFLGFSYKDQSIEETLKEHEGKITYTKYKRSQIIQSAAKDIADGKVIGWFQGRSEIGPRALGNRSIIAHPGLIYMKDYINKHIKFREDFRPFAPAVLKEKAYEYFEIGRIRDFPFMLFVAQVRKEKVKELPAITHVDNSARLQTVGIQDNPVFYKLIKAFFEVSGLPIVLNTSFNTRGEPIVESPNDAISTFLSTNIDTLYIENYIVYKKVT